MQLERLYTNFAMKLFLLIILCFQLLQQDDAATFEGREKENMVDESLSYNYTVPEEEMGATVDQWNENTYEDTNNQFDSLKNEKDTTPHHLLNANTKQYSSGDIKASITIILMLVLEYYLDLKVIAELWWMHSCSSSCKKWSTSSNVFIKGQ